MNYPGCVVLRDGELQDHRAGALALLLAAAAIVCFLLAFAIEQTVWGLFLAPLGLAIGFVALLTDATRDVAGWSVGVNTVVIILLLVPFIPFAFD